MGIKRTSKLTQENIQYFVFQGGGGKGLVYSGAIIGLELVFKKYIVKYYEEDNEGSAIIMPDPLPLFPLAIAPKNRQLKGIAGASAGAINAFCLAMGMDSEEIQKVLDKTEPNSLAPGKTINSFEKFFESPKLIYRYVTDPVGFLKAEREKKNVSSWYSDWLSTIMSVLAKSFVPLGFLAKFFLHNYLYRILIGNLSKYIENIARANGLFSGFEVRKFFETLMRDNLLEHKFRRQFVLKAGLQSKQAHEITFSDFFNITGVDLVITSINIVTKMPKLFSVYHTPDFPVTEAVGMSMSIPIAFKPVIAEKQVDSKRDEKYNREYHGIYVDGGMLLNYPIHVFDKTEKKELLYQGETYSFSVSAYEFGEFPDFCNCALGFRLAERPEKDQKIFIENPPAIGGFSGLLLSTIMATGESGQIYSQEEANKTIVLECTGISTLDFATPLIDELRKTKYENGNMAEHKKKLINQATYEVMDYFDAVTNYYKNK